MNAIANKLLEAFFVIGGNRRFAQRMSKPRKLPNPERQRRAELRRQLRGLKRLAWQAEYDRTYYRAAQLAPRSLQRWGDPAPGSMSNFLNRLEAVLS